MVLAAGLLLAMTGIPSGAAVFCAGHPVTHQGTTGNDVLVGTPNQDVFLAGKGDDVIRAGKGADIVCAGLGDDKVYAGAGNDIVYGQGGNDLLLGGNDFDTLYGGDGADVLAPQKGFKSVLDGGAGNDRFQILDGRDHDIKGRTGRDTLDFRKMNTYVYVSGTGYFYVGGNWDTSVFSGVERYFLTNFPDDIDAFAGSQLIKGMAGADTLKGGDGNDRIFGNDGADQIWGENGDDYLDGGAHFDDVYGQNGTDTCKNFENTKAQTSCEVFP
jgi:Ca2+-binding RTX toxin-like protein